MKKGHSLLTVVFVLVTSGFLWASVELSTRSAWIAQAVLAVTLLLLLLQLAIEQLPLRWPRGAGHTAPQPGGSGETGGNGNGSLSPALAWIAALPLAVWLFGTAPGSALFCLAWLRWHSGERWVFSSLFALALGIAVHLLFGILFRAELPQGVLLGLIN